MTMQDTKLIAVIAAGAMGSAVGQLMHSKGADVGTWLEGRGAASRARAAACHMRPLELDAIAGADVILSIVPPAEALTLATTLAPALHRAQHKARYVDCNAVNPTTLRGIAETIAATGASFTGGAIIGLPPVPGGTGPTFYFSGPDAAEVAGILGGVGLDVRVMGPEVTAAAALKMSYAGITKGLTALAAMMALGAARAGAQDALLAELTASQGALRTRFGKSLPDMVPKAYRWVAEMREIASFLDDDPAAASVFEGIAQLYERLAADVDGPEVAALRDFAAKASA